MLQFCSLCEPRLVLFLRAAWWKPECTGGVRSCPDTEVFAGCVDFNYLQCLSDIIQNQIVMEFWMKY